MSPEMYPQHLADQASARYALAERQYQEARAARVAWRAELRAIMSPLEAWRIDDAIEVARHRIWCAQVTIDAELSWQAAYPGAPIGEYRLYAREGAVASLNVAMREIERIAETLETIPARGF